MILDTAILTSCDVFTISVTRHQRGIFNLYRDDMALYSKCLKIVQRRKNTDINSNCIFLYLLAVLIKSSACADPEWP